MKVFVTGGSGLIGSHVVRQLVARGDSVRALARSDRSAAAVSGMGAGVVRGDATDASALVRGAEGVDAVVHSAAVVLDGSSGWELFRAVNVVPAEAVARAAARAGARLVHISSVAVYGRRTTYDGGPGSVDEDFGLDRPITAGDHYARSKREAELGVWKVAEETGLSVAALRPCVVYGENDRNFSPRVARQMVRGWTPIVGTGTNILSVVYAGNVAAAVLAALDRPDVGGAFNVTNDGALTQREFVDRFCAGLGVRPRRLRIPSPVALRGAELLDAARRLALPRAPVSLLRTAVRFLSAANPYVSERAARVLGWSPVLEAGEAAERTGRWFRDMRC